ncbi:WXG100 family type VII secretion target [Pseudonocardia lacus]|uniref:WXG100 family type VII secretion target n=1 Tax=Pseudonocardia lacus TaxID=2835865 RepID=UPI001BDCDA61|nr:hypothetical protein [Pseudonocardia lacus]
MSAPFDVEPETPNALDGAGIFSSYDDGIAALGSGDGFEIVCATAAAALDTLGFVVDPFGSLFSAGAGWIMEHVGFLSDLLGVLAGDPDEVVAEARSWHRVSVELSAVAAAQQGLAVTGAVPWTGEAADAYRQAAQQRAERMAEVSAQVDLFATALITSAAYVGTVRSVVRDAIADFIAEVVKWLLLGSFLALVTSGVSLAAAIGWAITDAIVLAGRLAERIARLLEALADAGGAVGGLASGVLRAGRWTAENAGALRAGAEPVNDRLGGEGLGAVVEAGKQASTTTIEEPPPGS